MFSKVNNNKLCIKIISTIQMHFVETVKVLARKISLYFQNDIDSKVEE